MTNSRFPGIRTYQNAETRAHEPPGPGIVGAYALKFPATGHEYYGSAKDLRKQINLHLKRLAKGEHHSSKVQRLFNTGAPMVFAYVSTETLEEARAITREHIDALRGTRLLCNERTSPLQSRASRAKAKLAFQTEAYKIKAGKSRKALWEDPDYRERLLTKRASPEIQAKRAAHFRRISIDEVVYPGLTAAARATGLSRMTLDRRCKDSDYPTYFYLPPLMSSARNST
ncbi:hypothetical protein [Cupriavidus sp. H18C2]|uniref:hypothetical protein n=1 Tax=Cupriavidus sp. H18C2 TaxID=3241602 RepID=UPI003BF7F343